MKVCIYEHKKLFINTVISFMTFFIFFLFLVLPNEDWSGWGEWGYKFGFLRTIIENIKEFVGYCLCEDITFHIFIDINSAIFMFIILIVFIYVFIVLIKKDKKINYIAYIWMHIIYLISVIYIYIASLHLINPYVVINKYLSTIMLIPIIAYQLYNVISFIIYKKKI